jgi:hypothetical protein
LARCIEWVESYHFQSPYTSDPDLDQSFDALHIIELNTLPPASSSRLPPEKKKLLGHTNCIVVGQVTANVGAELGKGETANNCFVGLRSTVAPLVFTIKSSMQNVRI